MIKTLCQSCLKNETLLFCSDCLAPSCKKCSCFIDEDEFEYQVLLPEKFKAKTFCSKCFELKALPVLNEYREILVKAKNINVYDITQGSETGRMPRQEKPIVIEECNDREETLLRLAFQAAMKGYNTLIDVDLRSKKVSQGGKYKKLVWSGKGIPIDIKSQY